MESRLSPPRAVISKTGTVRGNTFLISSTAETPPVFGSSQSIKTIWQSPLDPPSRSTRAASSPPSTISTVMPISFMSVRTVSRSCMFPITANMRDIPLFSQNSLSVCPSGMRNSNSTRKRLPLFTSLDTWMVPPISSTIFFVIAIPRPVPCTLFVVLFSARVNASKIVFKYSCVIPYPSSSTSIRICSNWLARCPRPIMRNQIWPPSGVYLTAFPSMFTNTCRSREASPSTASCWISGGWI